APAGAACRAVAREQSRARAAASTPRQPPGISAASSPDHREPGRFRKPTREGAASARGPFRLLYPPRPAYAGDGFQRPNGSVGTGLTFPPQMKAEITGRRGGFAPPWITIPGGSTVSPPPAGATSSAMHHSVLQWTSLSSPTARPIGHAPYRPY